MSIIFHKGFLKCSVNMRFGHQFILLVDHKLKFETWIVFKSDVTPISPEDQRRFLDTLKNLNPEITLDKRLMTK